MEYGQVIIGPPGSGKSTYCNGIQQFLKSLKRKVVIINLDPANHLPSYDCDIDLAELITVEDVMDNLNLGPNASMIYCLEYLEQNMEWLYNKLKLYPNGYFVFDCPGQLELYTHNNSFRSILKKLNKLNYQLTCINLVDSHYCSDPPKFISVLLLSLQMMMLLEMPHINVLSKIDLIESFGMIDYYTEVMDLSYLLTRFEENQKFTKLNKVLCELIEDFGLVHFITLNVEDKESMFRLLKLSDKANGYIFAANENVESATDLINSVISTHPMEVSLVHDIQEKYIDHKDVYSKFTS